MRGGASRLSVGAVGAQGGAALTTFVVAVLASLAGGCSDPSAPPSEATATSVSQAPAGAPTGPDVDGSAREVSPNDLVGKTPGVGVPGIRAPFFEPPAPAPEVIAEQARALRARAPLEERATRLEKRTQLQPVEAPAAVAPELIAKENEYLSKWEKLRPGLAKLSPDEQERQRAALKAETLGN